MRPVRLAREVLGLCHPVSSALPPFFTNVAFKGFSALVSHLESVFTGSRVSVDSKSVARRYLGGRKGIRNTAQIFTNIHYSTNVPKLNRHLTQCFHWEERLRLKRKLNSPSAR